MCMVSLLTYDVGEGAFACTVVVYIRSSSRRARRNASQVPRWTRLSDNGVGSHDEVLFNSEDLYMVSALRHVFWSYSLNYLG